MKQQSSFILLSIFDGKFIAVLKILTPPRLITYIIYNLYYFYFSCLIFKYLQPQSKLNFYSEAGKWKRNECLSCPEGTLGWLHTNPQGFVLPWGQKKKVPAGGDGVLIWSFQIEVRKRLRHLTGFHSYLNIKPVNVERKVNKELMSRSYQHILATVHNKTHRTACLSLYKYSDQR